MLVMISGKVSEIRSDRAPVHMIMVTTHAVKANLHLPLSSMKGFETLIFEVINAQSTWTLQVGGYGFHFIGGSLKCNIKFMNDRTELISLRQHGKLHAVHRTKASHL